MGNKGVPKLTEIVTAAPEHEQGWRTLWDLYCDGHLPEATTDATWCRILDPASAIGALVAVDPAQQLS